MIGAGSFDTYCDICGLPFRQIDRNLVKTKWLIKGILRLSDENVPVTSHKDHGKFELRGTSKNKLPKTIYIHDILEKFPQTEICHRACLHRKDMKTVLSDLKKVKEYQSQFFEDEEFVKDTKLKYLMTKPEEEKSIQALSIKELHDVCEKLGVKKGSSKAELIENIKKFVC